RDGRYLSTYGRSGLLVVRRLVGHKGTVCFRARDCSGGHAAFTPDSTKLAYVMNDTRIAVIYLASGQVRHLPPSGRQQGRLEIAPNGRRFAVSINRSGNYAVELRDLESGKVLASLPHPARASARRGWHPSGWMVATTCEDRLIRLWDVGS